MISDDDDNISLPEIMKLHLPIQQQHYLNEPEERVHGQDEPSNDIEQYTATRPFQPKQRQQNQFLTRNQRKNRKKRANRYRFEIIRQIYHKFNITNIKKI